MNIIIDHDHTLNADWLYGDRIKTSRVPVL